MKVLSVKEKLEKLRDYAMTDGLPDWEENFVGSVCGQLENASWNTTTLSGKQVEKIEELYERRIIRGTGQKRLLER